MGASIDTQAVDMWTPSTPALHQHHPAGQLNSTAHRPHSTHKPKNTTHTVAYIQRTTKHTGGHMAVFVMTRRAKGRRPCQHTTTHQDTTPRLSTLRGACAAAAASVPGYTQHTHCRHSQPHNSKAQHRPAMCYSYTMVVQQSLVTHHSAWGNAQHRLQGHHCADPPYTHAQARW